MITGYNDNFESTILNDKIKNIVFWKFKKSSFDYKIDMNKVEKITFMNYTTLDIRNIKAENIKSLSVDKTKKLIFNLDNLLELNYLSLCSCDTSSINNEVIGQLKQLEELWLEKCDLSFIDENTIISQSVESGNRLKKVGTRFCSICPANASHKLPVCRYIASQKTPMTLAFKTCNRTDTGS